ncbi:ABC transporter ATP-binding protein/permease [Marinilongibacter aquaticus]|uniref:ABC transporter ATP-binding protein n=1 Tax=Marinilongibacter aquaticus TaxID=2975157 RepID=UPI0021BD4F04|nr:ABC transporter ATP-binding protein [Marinilongibacter aquaticus]UBM59961.1 ABC transporter ATP-binding protein/permease [Marinilongibacter aquaticus]
MQEEKLSGKIFDGKVIKRLIHYIKPYSGRFGLLVFVILLGAALSPILPLMIKYTIDGPISSGNYGELSRMLMFMIGLLFVTAMTGFFNTYLAGWLGQNIIRDIRIELYEKILSLRLRYFDETPIGRLVTRAISDIETLSNVFSSGFAAIAGDVLQLVLIISVMFYTDWRLSLISLSTIPLMLISTYIFKEKVKKSFNIVRNAVSNLNSFMQEHITGMSLVQIFNSEKLAFDQFVKINKKHREANIKSILYYSVYYPVAEVIAALGTGLVVWYGAKQIIQPDSGVTFGTVTAFIMFINQFFRPIRMIADRINTLQLGIVSTDRILKVLDSEDIIPNEGTLKKELQGDVEFKNVWFAYKDENYVLKDISFQVKEGETVAFVGATGAGKSSIINLLTRFYEINKGQILIDGIDLKEYEVSNLRKQIGMVLQDVFLFSDTIRNNITLNDPEISDEEIEKAAKLVGVNNFIQQLPGGYDYNVMERGSTLSVGQRQLISFVRAMVQNPHIIVLDEATSSIDSESEELIQNAIEKLMKGRTAIVIAHRLSTIQKADKIVVVDKGQLVEMGTHEELLNKKGHYANLYEMQYAATAEE